MRTKLIVSVDTEEEGLWGGEFRTRGNTVRNVGGIPRFQGFCEQYGLRPTYLVDTPVADDDRAASILGSILDRSGCEIGAHLHPWCAPPLAESADRRHTFTSCLPASLQHEKIAGLTETLERRFGHRPTSFRAGRYGLDGRGIGILRQLGYVVDSSVLPYMDFSDQGGPDFRRAPFVPYYADEDDICTSTTERGLLEIPISAGFSRPNFSRMFRWRTRMESCVFRRLRLVGLLDRTNFVRRIKFSPEQANAHRLKQLADAYVTNGAPCLVMLLHSSSLMPGYSPYVPDASHLEAMYRTLAEIFEHCLSRHGMAGATLTEFATSFGGLEDRVSRQLEQASGCDAVTS